VLWQQNDHGACDFAPGVIIIPAIPLGERAQHEASRFSVETLGTLAVWKSQAISSEFTLNRREFS